MRQHQLLYIEPCFSGHMRGQICGLHRYLKDTATKIKYILSAAEMSPKTQKRVSVPMPNGLLVKFLRRSEKEIKYDFVCVDPEYSTLSL